MSRKTKNRESFAQAVVVRRQRRSAFGTILHYAGNVLAYGAIVFLIMCLITAIRFQENPSDAYVLGVRPVFVQTGSMEPLINVNSMLIVQKIDFEDVKKDDIIMYESGEKMITHRVIEVTPDGLQTKGDANNLVDAYLVKPASVRGKVIQIWNWTKYPMNDICPDGFGNGINMAGLAMWVGIPLLLLFLLDFLLTRLARLFKREEVILPAAPSASLEKQPMETQEDLNTAFEQDELEEDALVEQEPDDALDVFEKKTTPPAEDMDVWGLSLDQGKDLSQNDGDLFECEKVKPASDQDEFDWFDEL